MSQRVTFSDPDAGRTLDVLKIAGGLSLSGTGD